MEERLARQRRRAEEDMAYLNRPRREDGTSTPSVEEDAATVITPGPTTTLYPDCMLGKGGIPLFLTPLLH
jgi:hypothetical protein